jgi:hypothetical protein
MENSVRRVFRLSIVGGLLAVLTLLSWLPLPLRIRSVVAQAPATVARDVPLSLSQLVANSPRGFAIPMRGGGMRFAQPVRTAPTTLCPGFHFTAFVLAWTQTGTGTVSAVVESGPNRTRYASPVVVAAQPEGPDPGTPEDHPSRRGTNLVWVGDATCARFSVTFPRGAEIANARAVFVNTLGTANGGRPILGLASAPAAGGGLFGATPAEALTNRPGIITRAQWGANEKYRNCGPYYSSAVKVAFVHHTATENNYTRGQSPGIVRAIYYFHTKVLGWCDIGYNFLVDKFGQIFEGRYGGMWLPVLPGAQRGFNTNTFAVAAIGSYQLARPTSALIASLERLIAWRLDVAHVSPFGTAWLKNRADDIKKFPLGKWVQFNHISGHRDANYTDCPGDFLYPQLATIRRVAYNIGLPKIFDVTETPTHFVTGQGTVTWTAKGSASMRWQLLLYDASNGLIHGWWTRGSTFSAIWDGKDVHGVPMPPGEYKVVLTAWNGSGKARGAQVTLIIDPVPNPCPPPPGPSPSPSPSPCPSPSPSPSSP